MDRLVFVLCVRQGIIRTYENLGAIYSGRYIGSSICTDLLEKRLEPDFINKATRQSQTKPQQTAIEHTQSIHQTHRG